MDGSWEEAMTIIERGRAEVIRSLKSGGLDMVLILVFSLLTGFTIGLLFHSTNIMFTTMNYCLLFVNLWMIREIWMELKESRAFRRQTLAAFMMLEDGPTYFVSEEINNE